MSDCCPTCGQAVPDRKKRVIPVCPIPDRAPAVAAWGDTHLWPISEVVSLAALRKKVHVRHIDGRLWRLVESKQNFVPTVQGIVEAFGLIGEFVEVRRGCIVRTNWIVGTSRSILSKDSDHDRFYVVLKDGTRERTSRRARTSNPALIELFKAGPSRYRQRKALALAKGRGRLPASTSLAG